MSDYTITIPESLYDKVRRFAEAQSENVDEWIQSQLKQVVDDPRMNLPQDERAELDALHFLSDDVLWAIAREQMAEQKQTIMQSLMDKNTSGTIDSDELSQLNDLVMQGQRLTLRKAEAMKILVQRGHTLDNNE